MKLSARLKDWREKAGFTQQAAAKHLGVTLRTLENWEQGFSEPRGLSAEALRHKLGWSGGRSYTPGDLVILASGEMVKIIAVTSASKRLDKKKPRAKSTR